MSDAIAFKVEPVEGKFQVQDFQGNTYGTYDDQTKAEEAAQNWAEYYAAPLVF